MILLNGAIADDRELDPKRHKFIGTFRFPYATLRKQREEVWKVKGEKFKGYKRELEQGIITEDEFQEKYKALMNYRCPCGLDLLSPYKDEVFEHYQLGHFDLPQYVNI